MLGKKTAHFRLSSVDQKRRSLKIPNNSSMDHKDELRQNQEKGEVYKSSYDGFILTETLGRRRVFGRKLLGRASKVIDFQGYL